MDVDEARRDQEADGVDDLAGILAGDFPDYRDGPVPDGDIGTARWRARPVDDPAAHDGHVVAGSLAGRLAGELNG